MCYRSLLPKHSPDESDRTGLFSLQGQTLTQLSTLDHLNRLKLKGDLEAACRVKARWDVDEHQSVDPDFETTVEAVKADFVAKARNYLVPLLELFLGDISLNADIVKGTSSFDPVVLFTVPSDQAALCFSALFLPLQSVGLEGKYPRSRGPR